MDEDIDECKRGSNGMGLDPTSSSIQISSSSVRRESYALDMHNDVKPTTLRQNNLYPSQQQAYKSTNHNTSPPQDYSNNNITAAVSNEDEDDGFVVVSQEVVQPSSLLLQDTTDDDLFASSDYKIGDTPSKTTNGRKSTTSDTKSRRRSLRIQERALATPEKNNIPNNNAGAAEAAPFMSEPIAMEDELNTEEMLSNDSFASNQPSRRSSIRILARKLNSPSPAVAADKNSNKKKSQTKRRYSQSGRKASPKRRNKDEGKKLTSRNSQKPQGVDNDGMMLLPPKQLMPGEKKKKVEEKAASSLNGSTPPSVKIGISKNGHGILTQALEKIVCEVVESPLSGLDNASTRKSLGPPSGSKKRGDSRCGTTSVLESLDDVASTSAAFSSSPSHTTIMEHDASISSTTKKARPKNRRDTFDLSKKRGLTSAARAMDLNVLIDDEVSNDNAANQDYVTPKAGSAEVNIDAMQKLNDEPKEDNQNTNQHGEDTEEYVTVKNNLSNLTSDTIKERMEQLVPDKVMQINKYPCVSARIFAAMSIVYADQANFTPLLPFLTSLIDAEIVSLQNKEENEVCFISKKVCFSGFDYSSTTTAVGEVVGQGGGDLGPSIKALETVLQQALKLPRPAHYLDVAIQCLHCMNCDDVSDAMAKTMFVRYFPSQRFVKALKHYMNELEDIKSYVLSQSSAAQDCSDDHMGARYRLNDFIGRSVRFHLRELLNTIPENVVDFNVDDCAERWGRAVDDRSVSSILNYSLERINDLQTLRPELFEYGEQNMPDFFKSEASIRADLMSRDDLKKMDKSTYESLVLDIMDARLFLVGARACKFALSLLQFPGVEKHIASAGGWGPVEAIASTFYKLNLHEESENCHFAQLREVRDLVFVSYLRTCFLVNIFISVSCTHLGMASLLHRCWKKLCADLKRQLKTVRNA